MSAWPWPTTADVALRAFAPSYESLLIESAIGVQTLLASPEGNIAAPNQIRHYGEWHEDPIIRRLSSIVDQDSV